MGKVLVLGSDTRSFLAVIRSLGRRGLEVHVGWCPAHAPARASRYVTRVHQLPAYTRDGGAWKQALVSLLRQERFDLVIPCDDPTMIPLQHHRADLEPHGRIYLLDDHAFRVTSDKIKSYELAASLGVQVPHAVVVTTPAEAERALDRLSLPVVVKPAHTFTPDDLVNRGSVRRATTPEQLVAHIETACARGPVLVQEHFAGAGAGVEVLADQGRVLVAFQHLRIHEPLSGGGSSYRKSVPLRRELLEAAQVIIGALQYTGVAMVEFRINPDTNDWIFVEINGRFWGSLPLAIAAGVDFPYYLYQLLVEGRREFPQDYATGLFCRNLWLDAVWIAENLRALRSRDPAALPLSRMAGEILHLVTLRERSDTFVLDDARPGFVELGQLIGAQWTKAQGRAQVAWLAVPPVRRARARRAAQALREAKKVLFVCKGNICRSPFAAHYLQARLQDSVQVESCGYYPRTGRLSPDLAQAVAGEFGVDLTTHRSRVVTRDMVANADVVFVFDAENYATLAGRYPEARERLHLVGNLMPGGQFMLIGDPFGGEVNLYRTVYGAITRALDAGLKVAAEPHILAGGSAHPHDRGTLQG